jgi:hypothetical protein
VGKNALNGQQAMNFVERVFKIGIFAIKLGEAGNTRWRKFVVKTIRSSRVISASGKAANQGKYQR